MLADGRAYALGPRGSFVALDLATGRRLWSRNLADDLGVAPPYYGFASSPVYEAGRVLLQVGEPVGTIAAFEPATGELAWAAGDHPVDYQSPSAARHGAERIVLAAGGAAVLAVDPTTGEVLREHEHGGRGNLGAGSMTVVPAGPDAYFLPHSANGSRLIELDRTRHPPTTRVRWEEASIRNSYNIPVHHEGTVYGFSSRFLTAVDATTGKARWRSRAPGDGFVILVDGHLVVLTKTGTVAVGRATPDGFDPAATIAVFDDLAWTPPTFADGSLFVRSLGEIARVDVVRSGASAGRRVEPVGMLAALAAQIAEDGAHERAVARFLDEHPENPIVDGDVLHFVYRGPATDVAFGGDLVGARREEPMTRLGDSDLFFHTARVDPGTRFGYVLLLDFEAVPDPRNPRRTTSYILNGELEPTYGRDTLEMSWAATSPWTSPPHLAALPDDAPRGRLIDHDVGIAPARPGAGEEAALSGSVRMKVWVPPDYGRSGRTYPVVYVDGFDALDRGDWALALDHLVGSRVEGLIAVFVEAPHGAPVEPDALYAATVVPFVDRRYRTDPRSGRRALVGIGEAGPRVLRTALSRPDLFGNLGIQSAFFYGPGLDGLEDDPGGAAGRELRVYIDWARYDLRNPHENWDVGVANRRIADELRRRGFTVIGGEVPDGLGWANWSQRIDALLEALFPKVEARASGPR